MCIRDSPKTGQPTAPGDTEKRTEYFINGTGPAEASASPVEEASPVELPSPTPGFEPQPMEPIPAPTVAPLPSPRHPVAPTAVPDNRLQGTITLDIDPTTGLIAVDTCPIIRTKTFVLGTEPKKYCGPQYHNGKTIEPAATAPGRPRVVGTPPR